jgi:DNA repair photolyase
MLKKSRGNMYPWVTHTHSHLGGECPHRCSYCYVDNPRFGRAKRYQGEIRLIEEELKVDYGQGRTIFVEHTGDLFAWGIPSSWIMQILGHCHEYPDNIYVFQTKNPGRYLNFIRTFANLDNRYMLGTTIETNRSTEEISHAPLPLYRYQAMLSLRQTFIISACQRLFVTLEPILDFDLDILGQWLVEIAPDFVNIGADSKGHDLSEPPKEKVLALIQYLSEHGIEVRQKRNLDRLAR